MRQEHRFTVSLIALAISILAASPACKREEAAKSLPPPDVPRMRRHDTCRFIASGSVRSMARKMPRSGRVTGYLLRRDYQEGALVKKGAVLFEIDPRRSSGRSSRCATIFTDPRKSTPRPPAARGIAIMKEIVGKR
jgi:multidrug efflux pump subunit AcrA (membrane-fusion protein)